MGMHTKQLYPKITKTRQILLSVLCSMSNRLTNRITWVHNNSPRNTHSHTQGQTHTGTYITLANIMLPELKLVEQLGTENKGALYWEMD